MQDPTFNRVVDSLLRPTRPAPAPFVRVVVIYSDITPPFPFGDGAQVVHYQVAVANDKRLDVKRVPDFDMVVADVTDSTDILDTAFRFLTVRRPSVFVLFNQDQDPAYMTFVEGKAGDLGYRVLFENPAGSIVGVVVGTLSGVSPSWTPLDLREDSKSTEFNVGWVLRESIRLARIANRQNQK